MFIRKFIYKIEYKKLKMELDDLICFFDNRSESIACMGDEHVEREDIDKLTKRLNKVYYRVEELERILKL